MDTDSQLRHDAKKLGINLKWIGTKDNIPERLENGAYIVNLQDDTDSQGNDQSGTHWTAFIVEDGGAAYSDSFGFPPPAQVQSFLTPLRPYPYVAQQIQNTQSGHCGKYALYFLYFMAKHHKLPVRKRMASFTGLWSKDVEKNLRLLNAYLSAADKNPLTYK